MVEYKRILLRGKVEEGQVEIEEERLAMKGLGEQSLSASQSISVSVRICGEFANRAFFLREEYDWVIGKDDEGMIVLIPLLKKDMKVVLGSRY